MRHVWVFFSPNEGTSSGHRAMWVSVGAGLAFAVIFWASFWIAHHLIHQQL